MKNKKELTTPETIEEGLTSPHEIAFLIRSTRHSKHRILLELIYNLGLSIEEATCIRLNELDLISGIIQVGERFLKLPKHLNNLIKFHLKHNQHKIFLLETNHGPLREEAAEKIIQTLSLRYLGRPLSAPDMQSFSQNFYFPVFHEQNIPFQSTSPLPLLVS